MTTASQPWFRYPRFNGRQQRAVIIGAGIAGCQLSWHLGNAGWQVTVIERAGEISNGASGNPAGVVSPKMTAQHGPGEHFYRQAFSYAIAQLARLKAEITDLPWHPCGMLQLTHDERETKRWDALRQRDDLSLPGGKRLLQCVDAAQASTIAGIACPNSATYFPQAGWLSPRGLCEALLADCPCDLRLNTAVGDIRPIEQTGNEGMGGWRVFDNNNHLIAVADSVIFANGHAANTSPQTQHIPMTGVLGQSSLLDAQPATEKLRCVIGHQGYLTPAFQLSSSPAQQSSPVHALGASYQRHFNSDAINSTVDQENRDQLQRHLPRFLTADAKVSPGHAAIRATTPDRFPIAGGLPNVNSYQQHYAWLRHGMQHLRTGIPAAEYLPGLFILSGLGSRGLSTSGFCADLLSRLITDDIRPEDETWLERLHPARFLIKSLKTGR